MKQQRLQHKFKFNIEDSMASLDMNLVYLLLVLNMFYTLLLMFIHCFWVISKSYSRLFLSLLEFPDFIEPTQMQKQSKSLTDNLTVIRKDVITSDFTKNLFTELSTKDLELFSLFSDTLSVCLLFQVVQYLQQKAYEAMKCEELDQSNHKQRAKEKEKFMVGRPGAKARIMNRRGMRAKGLR